MPEGFLKMFKKVILFIEIRGLGNLSSLGAINLKAAMRQVADKITAKIAPAPAKPCSNSWPTKPKTPPPMVYEIKRPKLYIRIFLMRAVLATWSIFKDAATRGPHIKAQCHELKKPKLTILTNPARVWGVKSSGISIW